LKIGKLPTRLSGKSRKQRPVPIKKGGACPQRVGTALLPELTAAPCHATVANAQYWQSNRAKNKVPLDAVGSMLR